MFLDSLAVGHACVLLDYKWSTAPDPDPTNSATYGNGTRLFTNVSQQTVTTPAVDGTNYPPGHVFEWGPRGGEQISSDSIMAELTESAQEVEGSISSDSIMAELEESTQEVVRNNILKRK